MVAVLDKIPRLLSEFSPADETFPYTQPDKHMMHRDPLETAFTALRLHMSFTGNEENRNVEAGRRYEEYRHYSHNLSILVWTFFDASENYRDRDEEWKVRNSFRLMLDVEKLLSDTRSLLDSIFHLIAPYSEEMPSVSLKKKRSFGAFADWLETNPVGFPTPQPPLSFMCELIPWGQTIRRLRDNYIHNGHEGIAFFGDDGIFFEITAARTTGARPCPPSSM
jgi:hypothetical protein